MEPIAIIGLGCRFPGAETPGEFWNLLARGESAVREVPAERWSIAEWYDATTTTPGKMTTRWGGFLGAIDGFDPGFFGIAPREALHMDPQQRLMLEVAWEAMEDAGLVPRDLAGSSTGVFVGFGSLEYSLTQLRHPRMIDGYTQTGYYPCIIANRISYAFDFRGPSISLDTACSSSLVAISLACRSLRSGESTLALAGGVNLMIDPVTTVGFSKLSAMSPDGQCHTFDAAANGYVRGEGAGVLVLKRLAAAQADGDHVYAVIRGEAVNQDGRTNGLTAPSRWSQEAVLRAAYQSAGVSPGEVQYVEAHGTGTLLGDPIEAAALGSVLSEGRAAGTKCAIGSLKTNIGHLEAAAGIAGTIKLALALEHRQLPPHLNFETPNPHIPFADLPLKVQTRLEAWPAGNRAPLAGVSSFGFGGTNAHLVLEAAPTAQNTNADRDLSSARTCHILPISARDPQALRELAGRYAELLSTTDISLAEVCRSASRRRGHYRNRLAVMAKTAAEAALRCRAFSRGETIEGCFSGENSSGVAPTVGWLFSGQGSQYAGMGRQLYDQEPVFRAALDRCAELFSNVQQQVVRDSRACPQLLEVMFNGSDGDASLDDTAYTQPCLFALEYALAELWRSWGIVPIAVLGHSLGEYTAAVVAGILSLKDALRLVTLRAHLMAQLPRDGAMIAVLLSASVVGEVIAPYSGRVCVAADNGPENTVISGDGSSVAEASELLAARGIPMSRLNVSHAFHSPLIEPMREPFLAAALQAEFAPAQVPLATNLTGDWLPDDCTLSAEYLAEHIRSPVQFQSGITALTTKCRLLLEAGPGSTLLSMGKRCVPNHDGGWLPSIRRHADETEQMLTSLAKLYVEGVEIAWRQVYPGRSQRVPLPLYPFQRTRYWVEAPTDNAALPSVAQTHAAASDTHPLLGSRLRTAVPTWESAICRNTLPWLWDHQVQGRPLMPGAGWLEIFAAAAAAADTNTAHAMVLEQVRFLRPLLFDANDRGTVQCTVQCTLLPDGNMQVAGPNKTSAAEPWRTFATARVTSGDLPPNDASNVAQTLAAARTRCCKPVDIAAHYEALAECGLQYGPAFRALRELHAGNGEAIGSVKLPEGCDRAAGMLLHPVLLDAAMHVVLAAVDPDDSAARGGSWIPVGIEKYVVHSRRVTELTSHAVLRPRENPQTQVADLRLYDPQGMLVAEVVGLTLARASQTTPSDERLSEPDDAIYELGWRAQQASGILPAPIEGQWLVVSGIGRHDFGASVAECLRKQGRECVVIDFGDDDHRLVADESRPSNILYCAAASRSDAAAFDDDCLNLLRLVQTIAKHGTQPRQVWTATFGAEAVGQEALPLSLSQSAVGGLMRTLPWEYPQLRCTTIDFDAMAETADSVAQLLTELTQPAEAETIENRIAYRNGTRYVARLGQLTRGSADSNGVNGHSPSARQLVKGSRGLLEDLSLEPMSRRLPGAHEVEIRVQATGLNFRDVLNALDMYPGDAGPLGGECSGTILAVGDQVAGLEPGMEVMGLAGGSFADFVTVPTALVVRKPADSTFPEAASIPIAFLTAWFALVEIARLKQGERVLIHAAAGGVGLAAVQIAQALGAEVFATAGSSAKRELLRGRGVSHVMNSRTLDFADELRALTGGEGVEVVLNSLSGEFLERTVGLTRPDGRFVEIGKIGIWNAAQFAEVRPKAEYHVFDLAELAQREPERIQAGLQQLRQWFEEGRLAPLPVRAFPIAEANAAFRTMAQGKHVGKLVIMATREPIGKFQPDATYLITGGFGGLGLRTAEWLVRLGARRIVLVGRRLPADPAVTDTIARLRQQGAEIVAVQADVADLELLAAALRPALASGPALRGVIHCAGTLDDGVLAQQTVERFQHVFAAKAVGAWNLHHLTRDYTLDFFVGFSSLAALVGSPGQANYAAANAALDGLMQERRRQGLPALTVNWGPWSDVGMAHRTGNRGALGELAMLSPDEALRHLHTLLKYGATQAAVLAEDATPFFHRRGMPTPALLREAGGSSPDRANADRRGNLRSLLKAAPPDAREGLLMNLLRDAAGTALGLPDGATMDSRRPLRELGLDSLMSVELRNKIVGSLEVALPITLLFDYPTLQSLVGYLMGQLFPAKDSSETAPKAGPLEPSENAAAEKQTTADIAAQLAAELKSSRARTGGSLREQGSSAV